MQRNIIFSRVVAVGVGVGAAILIVKFLGWGALLLLGFAAAVAFGGGVGSGHPVGAKEPSRSEW